MTAGTTGQATSTVGENVRGTRDALSVRRVFGEPYELDGVTIIPVARITGGAGGGGGEGTEGGTETAGGPKTGGGFGTGFGLTARPVGVYEVRDGAVEWKPAIDVNRLARGGQVLAAVIALCLVVVFRGRRR